MNDGQTLLKYTYVDFAVWPVLDTAMAIGPDSCFPKHNWVIIPLFLYNITQDINNYKVFKIFKHWLSHSFLCHLNSSFDSDLTPLTGSACSQSRLRRWEWWRRLCRGTRTVQSCRPLRHPWQPWRSSLRPWRSFWRTLRPPCTFRRPSSRPFW